jgi:iron complex outermembrane receptor protein
MPLRTYNPHTMTGYPIRIAAFLRRPPSSVVASMLFALFAVSAMAQEVSEHDYLADLPVVLSVSRLAQPLNETPGAVTIIDAETIRRSGAREVAELLRLVPGFLVAQRNGGNTQAGYHAALDQYGARMQVYVDGRSVYSSYYFGDTHRGRAAVDLADIQRIEILRGSNSAAFGSKAFLGVVNIITRAAADTHGVSASVTRGDGGADDNFVRIGWGSDAASMRLSASRRSTTGYASAYDDSHRSQLQFRGDFRVGLADDLSVKLGVATESFGEGFPKSACTFNIGGTMVSGTCDENKERTDSWRNGYARFDWSRVLSETSMLKVAGGIDQELYQSSFLAERKASLPLPGPPQVTLFAPVNYGGKALRQNLEIQRTDVWTSNLRTVVGAEVLREEVRSPSLFSTDASISARQLRLFGGIEWKPASNWVVNTGGMWEKHSMTGNTFAPRLAVNYHLLPEHTLRAVTTQSFRMPSIYMLRGLGSFLVSVAPPLVATTTLPFAVATGNVKPESVIANEIGYLGEMRGAGLKLDVRAFSERINRRLTFDSVAKDMVNQPGPEIHGLEYQFDWRPFNATRIVFAEAQLREEAGASNSEHFEAPHRSGSVALYQKLPGDFDLSLITYYATGYRWPAGDMIDRMRQLDARLAYAFRVGATRGEVAAMVQSLGGSHMEYLRTQMFGRKAFVSLRLDF